MVQIMIASRVVVPINIQTIANGRNMQENMVMIKLTSYIKESAIVIYQIINIKQNVLFLQNL